MTFEVNKSTVVNTIKNTLAVLFVLAVAFSVVTSFNFYQYRAELAPFLGIVQFDINSRATEIQARFNEAQRSQAPATPTTSTTLPPKKAPKTK